MVSSSVNGVTIGTTVPYNFCITFSPLASF
jgi:hypothetical protein